jgi:hypothetical protein
VQQRAADAEVQIRHAQLSHLGTASTGRGEERDDRPVAQIKEVFAAADAQELCDVLLGVEGHDRPGAVGRANRYVGFALVMPWMVVHRKNDLRAR